VHALGGREAPGVVGLVEAHSRQHALLGGGGHEAVDEQRLEPQLLAQLEQRRLERLAAARVLGLRVGRVCARLLQARQQLAQLARLRLHLLLQAREGLLQLQRLAVARLQHAQHVPLALLLAHPVGPGGGMSGAHLLLGQLAPLLGQQRLLQPGVVLDVGAAAQQLALHRLPQKDAR